MRQTNESSIETAIDDARRRGRIEGHILEKVSSLALAYDVSTGDIREWVGQVCGFSPSGTVPGSQKSLQDLRVESNRRLDEGTGQVGDINHKKERSPDSRSDVPRAALKAKKPRSPSGEAQADPKVAKKRKSSPTKLAKQKFYQARHEAKKRGLPLPPLPDRVSSDAA